MFLRVPGLGPLGQPLPALLNWVKAGLGRGRNGEEKGEGKGEGKIAQRLWEGSAAADDQGTKLVLTFSNNCNF